MTPDNVPCKSAGLQMSGGIAKTSLTLYVAQVKTSEEKMFAWRLLGHGLEYFLPLDEVVKRSGRTRYVVRRSLFPGYVFLAGDDSTPGRAREMGQPCRMIKVPDQATLKRNLSHVEGAIDANLKLDVCPYKINGGRFRVTTGPLMGCEGVGIRREHHCGVIIEVEMLGRFIEAEVPWHMLEEVA